MATGAIYLYKDECLRKWYHNISEYNSKTYIISEIRNNLYISDGFLSLTSENLKHILTLWDTLYQYLLIKEIN